MTSNMDRVKVYLDLHFIAPLTLKIQLLPCLLDIDLKGMRVEFADTNGVHWHYLSKDRYKHTIRNGSFWEIGYVEP